jgi:hypothetical protein
MLSFKLVRKFVFSSFFWVNFIFISCRTSPAPIPSAPEEKGLFGLKLKVPSVFKILQPDLMSLLCFTDRGRKEFVKVSQSEVKKYISNNGVTGADLKNKQTGWGYWYGSASKNYYSMPKLFGKKVSAQDKLLLTLGLTPGTELKWMTSEAIQKQSNVLFVRPALIEHLPLLCLDKIGRGKDLYEVRARMSRIGGIGHPVVAVEAYDGAYEVRRIYRAFKPQDHVKLDYSKIVDIAKMASAAYFLEEKTKKPSSQDEFPVPSSYELIGEKYKDVYSVSYYDKENKILFVSYKGTSNLKDLKADAQLALGKSYSYLNSAIGDKLPKGMLDRYLKDASDFFDFYKKSLASKYPSLDFSEVKLIFTGHSLGAYLAGITAHRTIRKESDSFAKIWAFVFSAPAPFESNGLIDMIEPNPRAEIYNFYRDNDPVVQLSGRHPENLFIFNSAASAKTAGSHFLDDMISLLDSLATGEARENFFKGVKLRCSADLSHNYVEVVGVDKEDLCY